jgi:biopolymer transport protein ExbD
VTRWDVFHSGRLEVLRGLSASEVRAALARGELRDDDLIRPAGTAVPWARLADMPELAEIEAEPPPAPAATSAAPAPSPAPVPTPEPERVPREEFAPPSMSEPGPEPSSSELEPISGEFELDSEEEDTAELAMPMSLPTDDDAVPPPPADLGPLDLDLDRDRPGSRVALAVPGEPPGDGDLEGEEFDPLDEDEEAAEFTLSRGAATKIEEIDMAPMVDVAFQLVLFFLVTATTVLYKTLEVPKPNPEQPPPAAAAQGAPNPQRTLEDLEADHIVVAIDSRGAFTIDREPVPADMAALAERLRRARADTGRKAMLLSADAQALHRYAVIAYDAANEIGMRIAIARPAAK